MTSALATIALTYNAIDIQVFDSIFLEITHGLSDSPTVRGIDVTVPGLVGQVARPRRFHERRILLSGFVRGDGDTEAGRRTSFRANMDVLLALFDAAGDPHALVATAEDGSTRSIEARTLSVMSIEQSPSEWADVSIELVAVADWVITA
jgi:hypothetical protein